MPGGDQRVFLVVFVVLQMVESSQNVLGWASEGSVCIPSAVNCGI